MARKRNRKTRLADTPLKPVKVYSTPACPWCKVAKAYLMDNDIPFTDVDISRDRAGLKEMLAMTGQHGVPVLLVGEKAMVGWSPSEFEKLCRR